MYSKIYDLSNELIEELKRPKDSPFGVSFKVDSRQLETVKEHENAILKQLFIELKNYLKLKD